MTKSDIESKTRSLIVEAFWRLYQTGSIEKITVKQVAALAGVSRVTFYEYFRNVRDILTQIEEEILTDLQLISRNHEPASREIAAARMGEIIRFSQNYRDYAAVLLSDDGDPQFAKQVKNIFRPMVDACCLAQTKVVGRERDILREFYVSGLLAAISTWLKEAGDMDIERFTYFIIESLLTPPRQEAPSAFDAQSGS